VHHDANLGSAIRIYLTDRVYAGDFVNVLIDYTSNAQSIAINWLTPAQTASQTMAYMFT